MNINLKMENVFIAEKVNKMLIKRKDTYQVDTEIEAKQLIEDAKQSNEFELTKYSSQKKVEKKSGDEYFIVVLEKEYGI